MSRSDAVVALHQKAKQLLADAQRLEAETGHPDGAAYKAAAEAYRSVHLMEMTWMLDYRGKNHGQSQKTLERIRFLRAVVASDTGDGRLTIEALASTAANLNGGKDARTLWKPKSNQTIGGLIFNFIKKNSKEIYS